MHTPICIHLATMLLISRQSEHQLESMNDKNLIKSMSVNATIFLKLDLSWWQLQNFVYHNQNLSYLAFLMGVCVLISWMIKVISLYYDAYAYTITNLLYLNPHFFWCEVILLLAYFEILHNYNDSEGWYEMTS